MNIYVLGEDLQIIGVVNKYSALQWVDTWSKEGSFQLWAPLNDENSSLLVKGNLLWIEEDTLGVIQRAVRELDEEGERTISVSGKFVECWIQKRIIWGKFVSNNSFDSEQAVPDPIVLAEFDLAARTTASLEITVEFVNYPTVDQNAYQGFGNKGQGEKREKCYRQVIAYVAEKTESA